MRPTPASPAESRGSRGAPPPPPGGGFRGLLASDVDSTFLTHEVIELIADHAGVRDEVEAITTRAMQGELDFAASLRARVAMLEGLSVAVLDDVSARLELRDGARELVQRAHEEGWRVVLVSGGFTRVIAPLARELGIHEVVANELELRDGRLTGGLEGRIVTAEVKAETVRRAQRSWDIARSRTIAMGDGANDILMMAEAGHTVGVMPKPALAREVTHTCGTSLRPVVDLLESVSRPA